MIDRNLTAAEAAKPANTAERQLLDAIFAEWNASPVPTKATAEAAARVRAAKPARKLAAKAHKSAGF